MGKLHSLSFILYIYIYVRKKQTRNENSLKREREREIMNHFEALFPSKEENEENLIFLDICLQLRRSLNFLLNVYNYVYIPLHNRFLLFFFSKQ